MPAKVSGCLLKRVDKGLVDIFCNTLSIPLPSPGMEGDISPIPPPKLDRWNEVAGGSAGNGNNSTDSTSTKSS